MDIQYADVAAIIGYVFLGLFSLAVIVLYIVSMWNIFIKAKKPGWAVLIPFYNTLVQLEILGRPWWLLLLMIFIPLANIVIGIILMLDLAKVFGKSVGFGVGLVFHDRFKPWEGNLYELMYVQ